MPMDAAVRATRANVVVKIRRAALTYECTRIRLFSQSYGPVQESIDARGAGSGVCPELAMQWLAAQLNGNDFLGTLLGAGGAVNEAAMAQVVSDFNAIGDLSIVEQREYYVRRLRALGLFPSAAEVKNTRELGAQSITRSKMPFSTIERICCG